MKMAAWMTFFAHQRHAWNQVTWEALEQLSLGVRLEGQQRVEKALEQVRMLTKHLLEAVGGLGIQITHVEYHKHWLWRAHAIERGLKEKAKAERQRSYNSEPSHRDYAGTVNRWR